MSGFDTDLIDGLAQLLVARVTWSPGLAWHPEAYDPPTETGVFDTVMPQTPDLCVTLTAYGLGDDATQPMSAKGLQVKCRGLPDGNPTTCKDLAGAIDDALLGLFPVTLPNGVRVSELECRSSVSLGQDDTRRWSFASNYALSVYRPSVHRI